MAHGDDASFAVGEIAAQETGHLVDGIDGRGEPDPLEPAGGAPVFARLVFAGAALAIDERFQPFERKRQVRPALIVRHGVDLIDDHRADRFEHLAALLGG